MQQLNFSIFLRTFKHHQHFSVLLRALNLNVLNFSTFKDEGEPCINTQKSFDSGTKTSFSLFLRQATVCTIADRWNF